MIDPLISKTIAGGFAVLFVFAAWHKFSRKAEFAATLADYRVLPEALVKPTASLIPFIEMITGVAWLVPSTAHHAMTSSVVLLLTYIAAMAINLARGRSYIDCGCGLTDRSAAQPLSINLILRNGLLILLALLAAMPQNDRVLSMLDYVTLAVALLASTLLYLAASKLLENHADMRGWMKEND